jgi:predicted transcriptional regulator YdeE
MAKISVQQRKYFVTRIENSINEKISELKQTKAAQVQTLSEKEFGKYLKMLKIDKDMTKFWRIDSEYRRLQSKLYSVYNEVRISLGIDAYTSNSPSVYNSSGSDDLNKGFRYLCNQTATKQETETPEGKIIKQLEAKKRAAIDELHGINELEGLKVTVNNILKGADVPLLGE